MSEPLSKKTVLSSLIGRKVRISEMGTEGTTGFITIDATTRSIQHGSDEIKAVGDDLFEVERRIVSTERKYYSIPHVREIWLE